MSEGSAIDLLCYILILLQEISQGYDNASYRERTVALLTKLPYPGLVRTLIGWRTHTIPTPDFLNLIEDVIKKAATSASPRK